MDGTGNADATPATRAFEVDTTAPKAKIAKLPGKTTKRKLTVKFSATGVEAPTFECKLDDEQFETCRSPLKLKHLKPGKHKLQVRASDKLGNKGKPAKAAFKVIRKR